MSSDHDPIIANKRGVSRLYIIALYKKSSNCKRFSNVLANVKTICRLAEARQFCFLHLIGSK